MDVAMKVCTCECMGDMHLIALQNEVTINFINVISQSTKNSDP